MKVLYLINHAGKGGSEKYVESLAKGLIDTGNVPYLAYNEEGPLVLNMKALGIKCFHISMNHPLDIIAAKKLSYLCKKLNVDIVHSQFPRENYIALLANIFFNNVNVIYTSHINLKNNFMWKITNYFLTRKNSAIIAVCGSVKGLLIKNRYPSSKIKVIFNGVQLEENINLNANKNKVFIFTTLARLSPEKGLLFLLQSAELLANEGVKFKLYIAGDGPQLAELNYFILSKQLNNCIKLLGYVDETKSLLFESDAYINCSESEALSFAILEAMNCGLPIIATKVGGNIEIIQQSNCGILVDYNNAKEMAKAMKTLINNPTVCKKYSNNSRVGVQSVFNTKEMFSQTYRLYKSAGGSNVN